MVETVMINKNQHASSFNSQQKVIYSICMTTFNTSRSAKTCLESILSQIDDRFEVLVVDNQSTDGSLEMLKHYCWENKIRLIVTPCSRGLGRQIGVKYAHGNYILVMDMDDVFHHTLTSLLELYHKSFEGFMLLTPGIPGVVIAPKALIEKLGGYRDLNWMEDSDLYSRAARINRFKVLEAFKIINYSIKDKRLVFNTVKYSKNNFMFFREAFRLSCGPKALKYIIKLRLFSKNHPLFLSIDFILAFWGLITHYAYNRYTNSCLKTFSIKNFTV